MTFALTLAGCALILTVAWRTSLTPPLAVDATVPYGPRTFPKPLISRRPPTMPTTTDDTLTDIDDAKIGDVELIPAAPVLDNGDNGELDILDVIVNVGHARTPNGHHAIRILGGNDTLTASQAHQLHIDLETAARWVSDLRQDAGYTS